MILLFTTLAVTVIASAVILNKYIDFACSIMSKKNVKEHNYNPKVVYFKDPVGYSGSRQNNIVIDIPFEEVKVVKNETTDHNYYKRKMISTNKKD